MIKYKKGSILDSTEDIICHGCNCFCTMGGGVAWYISERWPEVYEADRKTNRGDKAKLGTWTEAMVKGSDGHSIMVMNLYTQFNYNRFEDLFEYEAFEKICKELNRFARDHRASISMPLIGAGLAGGDWKRISKIIEENIEQPVIVYVLPNEWKEEYER